MVSILVLLVLFSLGSSFFCSLAEAALYSVPLGHVKHLAESGSSSGKVLLRFKEDMSRPIAGILILNTIANTAGPSLAGAIVTDIYGEQGVLIFAIFISLTVLFLSEIIPKIIGVNYSRPVSILVARPLALIIALFAPLVWISDLLSRRVRKGSEGSSVSHQEVLSLAAMGREEGSLDHLEGAVIENVIGLDQVLVGEILTPRVAVFSVEESLTLGHIEQEMLQWNYTRVPLYTPGDEDHVTAYVRQRDLFRALAKGDRQVPLKQIARPMQIVPELMRVDRLLLQMIEKREHICAVVDEHGALAGIVTLEDIIEEIVGREITDEYDSGRKRGGRVSKRSLRGGPLLK